MSSTNSPKLKKSSAKTPVRPALISDASVSSVESKFSEMSTFDSDSQGYQTPITPCDSPKSQYFPRSNGKKNDDLIRLMWKQKRAVGNARNPQPSGISKLATPNAGRRHRAKSAPEQGQNVENEADDETLEDLVHQLGRLTLDRSPIDSPSASRAARIASQKRQRNTATSVKNVGRASSGNFSKNTRFGKAGNDKSVSASIREDHDLEAASRQELEHLHGDSYKLDPGAGMTVNDDTNPGADRPGGSASSAFEHHSSPSEPNVIGEVTSNAEKDVTQNGKARTSATSDGLESTSPAPTMDMGSVLHDDSTDDTKMADSSLAGSSAAEASKPEPEPNKQSAIGSRILQHFGPDISKRYIKLNVLHSIRQQNLDPKPSSRSSSMTRRRKSQIGNSQNDKAPKQPKTLTEYNKWNGYVYIFKSPSFPGCCKIGSTRQRLDERRKQWSGNCNLTCTFIDDPDSKCFVHYGRVEKLVHWELYNQRRKYKCWKCGTKHPLRLEKAKRKRKAACLPMKDEIGIKITEHGEWFEISEEKAKAVVEKWREWVVENEPFREDGSLRDKWIWKYRQAQNCVEMRWGSWILKKLPWPFRESELVESDWDWDRWCEMRWDDWMCYIFDRGMGELRSSWPQLERFLWHPGLIVWMFVGVAPFVAYCLWGGGKEGLCAASETMLAMIALWLFAVIMKS